jgi:hypothetical protein
MRQDTHCAICKGRVEASKWPNHWSKFALSFRPNARNQPKIWLCRPCIAKFNKLDDRAFVRAVEQALEPKEEKKKKK